MKILNLNPNLNLTLPGLLIAKMRSWGCLDPLRGVIVQLRSIAARCSLSPLEVFPC